MVGPRKRDLVVPIILSYVTCGIYAAIWMHGMLSDLYRMTGKENKATMDIVLMYVTCGIFMWVNAFKMRDMISEAKKANGIADEPQDSIITVLMILMPAIYTFYVQHRLNTEFDSMPANPENEAKN